MQTGEMSICGIWCDFREVDMKLIYELLFYSEPGYKGRLPPPNRINAQKVLFDDFLREKMQEILEKPNLKNIRRFIVFDRDSLPWSQELLVLSRIKQRIWYGFTSSFGQGAAAGWSRSQYMGSVPDCDERDFLLLFAATNSKFCLLLFTMRLANQQHGKVLAGLLVPCVWVFIVKMGWNCMEIEFSGLHTREDRRYSTHVKILENKILW